jgi:hypothetical protein
VGHAVGLPQPDTAPVERHSPTRTDRWRLSGTPPNGRVSHLQHVSMPKPGNLTDPNAERQPAVRVAVMVPCDPLPEDELARPTRQSRLCGFLTGQAVASLVNELTVVEAAARWAACGGSGPDHLGAAVFTDPSEASPVAAARLNLPYLGSPQPMTDPRFAEFILEIKPRTHGGLIAPPRPWSAWRDILGRVLILAEAVAAFLTDAFGVPTYDNPATVIGLWLTTPGDLAQLVDVDGYPTEPGTPQIAWFIRYAATDPSGQRIEDTVQTCLHHLADDLRLQDYGTFLGHLAGSDRTIPGGDQPVHDAGIDQIQALVDEQDAENIRDQDRIIDALSEAVSFTNVASAMTVANIVGALPEGEITVHASTEPRIDLTFSWQHHPGDGRFSKPSGDFLGVTARVDADPRAGGTPVIQTIWMPDEKAETVIGRINDQLRSRDRWNGPKMIDWAQVFQDLHEAIVFSVAYKRGDPAATWRLHGGLFEFHGEDWAITEAGIEYRPSNQIVLAEDQFPERSARSHMSPRDLDGWAPAPPEGADAAEWQHMLWRGLWHFPVHRGPVRVSPGRFACKTLPKPPAAK